ncbi:F-box only protein 44-like [Lasioglossum baleicum]|uniref:F-box only protein 44-like n=1 Tax=Lasioglossum baleicum TaxID=434251 RepID=UPI003FCCADCF
MGQFHDNSMSTREEFDEESENGLIFADRYIPGELLTQIFTYVDHKSLLSCQLVCKRWEMLIKSYVWRKVAELTCGGQSLLLRKEVPWHVYYFICEKKPFGRNLIRNHSGEERYKHWEITREGGDCWVVENPPVGVPPLSSDDPILEGKQYCFTTSYQFCVKRQIIDLEKEGLIPYVLDNLRPPIEISEHYCCRWDCPAFFELKVFLVNENDEVMLTFDFNETITGGTQNQWHRVTHTFTNYRPGLRKIIYSHGGVDKSFWSGHYGSKMAGACVRVHFPVAQHFDGEDDCKEDVL